MDAQKIIYKENLIIPTNYIETENSVVFLAGPITGAPNWHEKAIEIFQDLAPDLFIASPKLPDFVGEGAVSYNDQVAWESHYLNEAGKKGVIMFWLAEEEKHSCYYQHARTSRFELGEWMAKHQSENANLVVGIASDFPGRQYIKLRLTNDCPKIPLVNSLYDACESVTNKLN